MRQEKLSELLDISIGRTPSRNEPEYWGNGHPWVSIRDLNSKIVNETKEQITNLAVKEARCRIVRKGTLLFSFKLTIGKMAFAGRDLFTNEAIAAFSIKDERKLNSEFLYYALRSTTYGGSNQAVMGKTLNSKSLAEIEIPVPTLDDQIRIAHLLGKVDGLIAQRKQHLQQLDDLLKSVFLEMFGDIRAKKSSHPWVALRPYLNANSGKSSKSVISEIDTGIPVFGGNGVNGWATKALYETPVVVAGRVGQQCGVIHVSKGPCWVTDNAIVLSISDDSRLNIVYLAKAFHYAPIRERVKQLDLPFISQPMLLDYPLPLPPIDLQSRFATIVEKVESLKSRYQESLTDLESLYGALSQQVFKGGFDLSRVVLDTVQNIQRNEDQQVLNNETNVKHENSILLATLEGRIVLLRRMFEKELADLSPGGIFEPDRFWINALAESMEFIDENSEPFGVDEYEQFKKWIFEKLDSAQLKQVYDELSRRTLLQVKE